MDTDVAHTYFKKKEFSKAIELYDTLIKEFSQEYDNYDDFIYNTYNRARSFCHLREYGNAIIDLNFVLEQKNIPFNMTLMSHFLRAKCYFNTDNHPGCLQDIDTVFQHSLIEIKKINEKLPNVTFTLKIKSTLAIAQSLITQKQCSEALNSLDMVLDDVLKKEYGDTDANLTGEIYLKRAYCKYLMDNHESAIQDLEKAVIFTENHLEIIKLRAKCNFQLGNFDDAKSDSDSVLNQIDDGEIQELKEKINLNADIKRLNQAWDAKNFENFIEISSKIKREYEKVDDDILLSMTKRRIEINFDLKKYLEGRSDCDLLLARDKKDFWALRWRIKFNFCLKNFKKVKKDCELYFVKFPTDEEIRNIFNSIDEKNNNSEDKKSFIEQAKRENAENSRRKNATYLELLQLDYAGIVPNVEPFECTICFVEYQEGEGVILRDCLHTFCKDCLSSTIQYCEDIEVMCPYKDTDYSCESVLQDREIKALVTPEMYEKHLAIRLRLIESQIKNTFHCLTANCTGWCIIEDEVNFFQCPVCNHENCITCRVIHEGKNCREYQDGLTSKESIDYLHQMVMSREAMHCPSCNIIIMKKSGCDGMTCSICKTEICWATRGPRRGPNGCRCRENGKKCHVSCVNCH